MKINGTAYAWILDRDTSQLSPTPHLNCMTWLSSHRFDIYFSSKQYFINKILLGGDCLLFTMYQIQIS